MQHHRTDSVTADRSLLPSPVSVSSLRADWLMVTLRVVALSACVLLTTGCRSLRPSDGEGLFAKRDILNVDNIRGPLERAFHEEEDALSRGEKFSAAGRQQVEVARQEFESGNYRSALASYKKIARKYAETSIGEEAWFRIGESHYAMKEYPQAQDAYDKLFESYPSTKHVANASRRLFAIAQTWLEVSDPETHEKIKVVSDSKVVEEGRATAQATPGLTARYGLLPNFFDGTRPLFDTKGRARNALKSIWLNDPTGPLADDALMMTATYYLQQGNHVEADRYFQILREEYPDSPHVEKAFVLGAHVKQLSYQGPYYDGTTLVAAENLKERSLSLFPGSEDRERIRKDLSRIYLLKAQRSWKDVELWQQKDNPVAVAIACREVIEEFPETRYAERARQELRRINPASVRHLPGMSEFLNSLPSASQQAAPLQPSAPRESEANAGPRVKSVGFRRLLPFGS